MTKVYPLRAQESERARWQSVADSAGLSFNAWLRRSLNTAADLEEALRRQEVRDADREKRAGG